MPPGTAPSDQSGRLPRLLKPLLAVALTAAALGGFLGGMAALGALLAAMVLLPFLIAKRPVQEGIGRVRQSLDAFVTGEVPDRLPTTGEAETADLARAFNGMLEAVSRRLLVLKRSEARFQALANGGSTIELWLNPKGRLAWINPAVEKVTGHTVHDCALASDAVNLLIYEKDRRHGREAMIRALAGHPSESTDIRLQCKDGRQVWAEMDWQPMPEDAGGGARLTLTLIGTRKAAEMKLLETVAELRRSQALHEFYLRRSDEERQRLGALLDVMNLGVLLFDNDHRLVRSNQTYLAMFGFPADENLVGVRDQVIMARAGKLFCDPIRHRHRLEALAAGAETPAPFEIPLTDGRVLKETTVPVPGSTHGSLIGRVWLYEDVTESIRSAERLTLLADRDSLTKLLNRRRFHEDMERMLADSRRRRSPVGLLMLDLDGFKAINDTWGHLAGDEVLVSLSAQVAGTVRRNEMFFRLGGDEFAILAPDSGETEMLGLARRVSGIIVDMRWSFGGVDSRVTASIGIAIYPRDGDNGEELVSHADQAMYRAKSGGRNAWEVYRTDPAQGHRVEAPPGQPGGSC